MSDTSVVRSFFDAFRAGDLETLVALLHDDVTVSEPAGLPIGGEYQGKRAFLQLLEIIHESYVIELQSTRLFDVGEFTLALINETWTSKATGASLRTRVCELYTVADGMITKIDVFPKDTRTLYELTVSAEEES